MFFFVSEMTEKALWYNTLNAHIYMSAITSSILLSNQNALFVFKVDSTLYTPSIYYYEASKAALLRRHTKAVNSFKIDV